MVSSYSCSPSRYLFLLDPSLISYECVILGKNSFNAVLCLFMCDFLRHEKTPDWQANLPADKENAFD